MENIVRLDYRTKAALARAFAAAVESGHTARICTGEDSHGKWVKWDTGGGWTPPYYTTDLPERFDYRHTHESVFDHSPAMMVRSDLDTITLVNECGDRWTDPVEHWRAL